MYLDIKKIIKKALLVIVFIMVFGLKVDAATCTTEEKKSLKVEANKIEIVKYFDDTYVPQGEYYYNVHLVNFNEKFYITDSNGNRFEYSSTIKADDIFGMYWPGRTVTFKIYGAKGKVCSDELMRTVKIKFPSYNDYSKHEACKGIENFKLCKRDYSGTIESEEWFLKQVEEYKKSLNEEKPTEEDNKKTFIEEIVDFITNNPVIFIVLLLIVITIIVIFIANKIKNRNKIKIDFEVKDKVGDKYDE